MMKFVKTLFALLLAGLCILPAHADSTPAQKGKSSMVKLHTNHGIITIKLDAEKAPNTVKNFLEYVNSGFYNNTIFNRVIESFLIQGG